MAQMKEEIQTPEKNLKEMEISNLSEALCIRMLWKFTGCFSAIKKTQAEMKVALSEIKKNLPGINSGVD